MKEIKEYKKEIIAQIKGSDRNFRHDNIEYFYGGSIPI